tara:strand:+ start:2296 stop:4275 length:1980 start_codon:yes stop_codon:yes gene_type:complete
METENNKYNLRSKGVIDDIQLELSPKKKFTKKSKIKFKVESTSPKRVINVDSMLNSNSEQSEKKSTKSTPVNNKEKKKEGVQLLLTKENTSGLAALALINSLVDSANKRMNKKNNKNQLTNNIDDDLSSSSDEDYTYIEDLDPEIEYTSEEEKYVKSLSKENRKEIIDLENSLLYSTKNEIPLRFRILKSSLPLKAISLAINRLDHFYTLDPSDNEYGKLYPWVNTLDKIPFGNNIPVPISKNDKPIKIQHFLANTKQILDNAVYGHEIAKTQIMSVIARQISNPNSMGNVIAIKGPMGNGKTTLVKEGICKAMKRPFALITLGGMSDASYLHGHEYTYEGARAGRIIEILTESKCMNPVIYFDELDKVSETAKGEEIINALCHLTDPSQNTMFQDKYYSGIDFDLSRALFIFSYNNEENINPILLDRMYKINTDGFNSRSKLKISKDYLLPKLLKEFNFNETDVTFTDDALLNIINTHCKDEKGVRNLKRNIETVISKLNIMKYLMPESVEKQPTTESAENTIPDAINQEETPDSKNTTNESALIEDSESEWVTDTDASDITDNDSVNTTKESNEVGPWTKDDSDKCVSDLIKNSIEMTIEEKIKENVEDKELENVNIKDVVDFTINNFRIPYTVQTDDISFFLKHDPINPSILHLYS